MPAPPVSLWPGVWLAPDPSDRVSQGYQIKVWGAGGQLGEGARCTRSYLLVPHPTMVVLKLRYNCILLVTHN